MKNIHYGIMYGYVVIGLLALWNYNKNALDQVKARIFWGTALVAGHIQSHIRSKMRSTKGTQRRIRGPQIIFDEDSKQEYQSDPSWSYYFLHDGECVGFHIGDLEEFIERPDIELFYARYKLHTGRNYCFVVPRSNFVHFLNDGKQRVVQDSIRAHKTKTDGSDPVVSEYKGPHGDFGFQYTGYRVRCEDIYNFDKDYFHFQNMSVDCSKNE